MNSCSGLAHHGDDFLHPRRVSRVAHPLLRVGARRDGRHGSRAIAGDPQHRAFAERTLVLLGRGAGSARPTTGAARAAPQPSARSISLFHMSDDESLLGEVRDPDGGLVVLPARIWEDKIVVDHPELRDLLEQVLEVISAPDHVEPDPQADRRRYYQRSVGPSKWLMVVVSFEQEPARIITALALRKDPKRWKP